MILPALVTVVLALGPADDPPPSPIARLSFLVTARKYLAANHQDATDDALIGAGQAVCDGLRAGVNLLAATQIGVTSGLTNDEASGLVGASIGALCPEFRVLIPN